MATKFEIEKFDGKNNFGLWQIKVRAVLVQQDLDQTLNGKEAKPAEITDAAWEKMERKALSTLHLLLADDVLYNIVNESTPAKLWKKLEDLYMTKSLTNRLYLKQRLFTLRMQEAANLHEHLNEFNKVVNQLTSIGVKLDDEDKALILLSSLPVTYEHLVTTLLYGKETISVEAVTAALLSNEMRKMTQESGMQSHDTALMVKAKKEVKTLATESWQKKPLSEVECFYCHKRGHIKRNCHKLKDDLNELKRQKGKTVADQDNQTSAMAQAAESEMSDSDVLYAATGDTKISDDVWVLDSACSFHVCPEKESFATYKAIKGGKALMGNGTACKVLGVGTVKIRMHDGVVRTLTGVRHVPGLKRNLISLGELDSKGCKISASGGAMRVQKRDRIVCVANKHGNLYVLNGRTIRTEAKAIWVPKVRGGAIAQDGAEDAATSSGGDKLEVELAW